MPIISHKRNGFTYLINASKTWTFTVNNGFFFIEVLCQTSQVTLWCVDVLTQFKRVRLTVINGDTIRIQIKISGPLQHPIPTKWPSWKTHLTYFRHIVINDELMETQATLTNCMKINQHKRYKNYFNEFHVTCCKTLGPMTARWKKKNIFFFQNNNNKNTQKQQQTNNISMAGLLM